MSFIQQLYHMTTEVEGAEKITRGVDTIMAIVAGNYKPEMFAQWLAYKKVDSSIFNRDDESALFMKLAVPKTSVYTTSGPFAFNSNGMAKVSINDLLMERTPADWIFSREAVTGPNAMTFKDVLSSPRLRTRRVGHHEILITYQDRAISIPYSGEFQSEKEVLMTMLRGYSEYLKLASRLTIGGGRIDGAKTIQELTNGLVMWREAERSFCFADYSGGSRHIHPTPMYRGDGFDWGQYGEAATIVYKAMVSNTIVSNILDFEQDATNQILKAIEENVK